MDEQIVQRIMGEVRKKIAERIQEADAKAIGDRAKNVLDMPVITGRYRGDPEPLESYESGKLLVDRPRGCAIRVQWAGKEVYVESDGPDHRVECYMPGEEWEAALDDAVEKAPVQALRDFVLSRWGLQPEQVLYDPESATHLG